MILEGGYYYDKSSILENRDISPKGHVLFVLSCGRSKPITVPHITTIHEPRKDYQILYMRSGSLHYVDDNGKEHIAPEGSFVIFKPYAHQEYTIYSADNADLYWCHFTGIFVETLFENYDLSSINCVTLPKRRRYIQLFNLMKKTLNLKQKNFIELCSLYLQELLVNISTEIDIMKNEQALPETFKNAIDYIEEKYYEKISLEHLAEISATNSRTLTRQFIKHTGKTPIKYLTEYRITKAKMLLLQTNHKIGDISLAVGFQDPLYFSTVFNSYEGVRPSEYRKNNLS